MARISAALNSRPFLRHVEPAVARQPGKHGVRKAEDRRFPARAHIFHAFPSIPAARSTGRSLNFALGQSHFCRAVAIEQPLCEREVAVYGVSVDQQSFSDGFCACRLHACRRRLSVRRQPAACSVSAATSDKAAGRRQGPGERAAGLLPEGDAARKTPAYFNTYAKGGEDDPAKLIYQASISDVTRSCSRATGMLTMNVAVAGRVVPGPAGASGTVTCRSGSWSLQRRRGALLAAASITRCRSAAARRTQFVFNDPNVTVPIPTDTDAAGLRRLRRRPAEEEAGRRSRASRSGVSDVRRRTIPTAPRSRRENPPSGG